MSDVYLSVPYVPIKMSEADFKSATTGNEERQALREFLLAIENSDLTLANRRVSRTTQIAGDADLIAYLRRFKISLAKVGQFDVEGYFALSGRVRFLIRPMDSSQNYRLFTFRRTKDGHFSFDESDTSNKIDACLNSAFLEIRTLRPAVESPPREGFRKIVIETDAISGSTVSLSLKATFVGRKMSQELASVNADLGFYFGCNANVTDASIDKYFNCFDPRTAGQLRTAVEKLSAERRDQWLRSLSTTRQIDFIIENSQSTFVFCRTGSEAVLSREVIEHAPGGERFLENPLNSFPLINLLEQRSIRLEVMAALQHVK